MKDIKVGLGVCGSYCTVDKMFTAAEKLCSEYTVLPIMSEKAAVTDTRFGLAKDHISRLEEMTGKKVMTEIKEVEPLGPKGLMDILVIAPYTLAKLATGVTDSSVTMAAKGLLRNGKPVVIAVSTNDGLSGSAGNIATLLNKKNIYFVPFAQDAPFAKPTSLVADFSMINETVECALEGKQIQPVLKV